MIRWYTRAELGRALDRIEKKLDVALADHEARLRRLERAMWIIGGLGLAGAITGMSGPFL